MFFLRRFLRDSLGRRRRRAAAATLPSGAAKLHNPGMFDWNDLKYFLAIARHGSTTAAGKALGLSQSTVQRRLTALERQIGHKLVSRAASGYRLTDLGQALEPYARRVADSIADLERRVRGDNAAGIIRMTCPEPIVDRIRPLIARFEAEHPGLRVEFVMSDRYLDLTKGDADVAFRSGDTDEELIGRKIADSVWAVTRVEAFLCFTRNRKR